MARCVNCTQYSVSRVVWLVLLRDREHCGQDACKQTHLYARRGARGRRGGRGGERKISLDALTSRRGNEGVARGAR